MNAGTLVGASLAAWLAVAMPGQSPVWSVTTAAVADGSSTEAGGYLLAIPGVKEDFVLFADGQLKQNGDGTARLSAYVQRMPALDREFYLELQFSGRIAPGEVGYPPMGSPIVTLSPGAYVPVGTVDPMAFVYYTAVTGTLKGLRGYEGALLSAVNTGAAQLGLGANNKNIGAGLALDLDLTVVQQPNFGTLAPSGPAELRATLVDSLVNCASHVDATPSLSNGPARAALALPGIATDYVFQPTGEWLEGSDGTASLQGNLRRQSDYGDEWQCSLICSGRLDPDDAAYPPAGSPKLELLPTSYENLGGPVDPSSWRYYTNVSGLLQGAGSNLGGVIQLQGADLQVGIGADQGNLFFGLAAELTPIILQQPPTRQLTLTGKVMLRANVATGCILPSPQVLTGLSQSILSVTQDKLLYTGIDLGWVEQAAIGQSVVGRGERRWFEGNVRVIDHTTVEVSVPQGLLPGHYPARLLNLTTLSNQYSVDIVAPTTPTLRSENDRLAGEQQHWVVHPGTVTGVQFCFVCVSQTNLPSSVPGLIDLDIGDQLSSFMVVDAAAPDPITGVSVVGVPSIPAALAGFHLFAQGALLANSMFPLIPSDVWPTDY